MSLAQQLIIHKTVYIQTVRFLIESPENWQKKLKINVPFSGIPFYDCTIPPKGTFIFL